MACSETDGKREPYSNRCKPQPGGFHLLFLESKLIREPSRLRLPEFCAASMHRSSRVRKALEILNAADPPPQPLSKPAGDDNTCREVQGVFLGAEWNAICRWLCGASTIDERKLCSGRAAMKS